MDQKRTTAARVSCLTAGDSAKAVQLWGAIVSEFLATVNAFWSITLYDAEGFQVGNGLNRFAVGQGNQLASRTEGSL